MKSGKKIKIKENNKYNKIFGTVDNKTLKAVYFEVSSWIEPKNNFDDVDYEKIVKTTHKNIKFNLKKFLIENYKDLFDDTKSIVDLDLRESGIKYGKRSYINCEITLLLNKKVSINTDEFINIMNNIMNDVIDNNFENSEYFNFYKTKK